MRSPNLSRWCLVVLCAVLGMARGGFATSFIVPTDREMVAKSPAVVIGTVEGSSVQQTGSMIETIYQLRVERTLKGSPAAGALLRVVSPGGFIGNRGVVVPGAAHFADGERVLLFLLRERGRWHPTDLTLGKFRFATSIRGDSLLIRDEEEKPGRSRKEQDFIHFIEDTVAGRPAAEDYFVDAPLSESTINAMASERIRAMAPFPASTYTSNVGPPPDTFPSRWASMSPAVVFHKKDDQDATGLPDGGVSVIQNGLAAWTNECGSLINLTYGGETPTPSMNFDSVHVVEFNDPQGRVAGSWTGAGTIAIAFVSYFDQHIFDGMTWWSITDGDVVFQDGFPGTHPAMPTAMTHEEGHCIGWRHSDKHHTRDPVTGLETPCLPAVEECSTNAIMNSVAIAALGYNLQTWDINASQAVYPGGVCCTPPAITDQPDSVTIVQGSSTTLSVTATGSDLTYQWYIGMSGDTSNPIGGATSSSVTVSPSSTTNYWVRVGSSCGSVDSNTATVTVIPPPQRSFVSAATGNDANICSRSAPCRQFAAAISKTAAGGEVIVLDSGGYGVFTVNKPISVISATGVYAGITAFSGDGITVDAGASDRIALRGLTLQGLGGAKGVHFMTGKALLVESCLINGFSNAGIQVDLGADGQLFVTDTTVRNGTLDGVTVNTTAGVAAATLDHVLLENNVGSGLVAGENSRVIVRGSTSSGNAVQFLASSGGPPSILDIEKCLAFGNGSGTGIQASLATIRVSNSTITNNAIGIDQGAGATIVSRGNNTLEGNAANNTFPLTFAPK